MKHIIRVFITLAAALSFGIAAQAQNSWNASTSTFRCPEFRFSWNISTSNSKIKWINKTPQRSTTAMLVNGGGIIVRVSAYEADNLDAWECYDDIVELVEGSLKNRNLSDEVNGLTNKVTNIKSTKSVIAGTHAVKTTYTNTISGYGEKEMYNAIDYTFLHAGILYSLEISYDAPEYSETTAMALFKGFSYL